MSNVDSRQFSFGKVTTYEIPSLDPSTWKAGVLETDDSGQLAPITSPATEERWVYAFRTEVKAPVLASECHSEYKVAPNGDLSVVSGKDARTLEFDKRPAPTPTGGRVLSLPTQAAGVKCLYWFYVSWLRLPVDSVLDLEKERPPFVANLDLADEASFVHGTSSQKSPTSPATGWFVPVIDPIRIAAALVNSYVDNSNRAAVFSIDENANKRHLLALLVRNILDSDPADDLNLKGHFNSNPEEGDVRRIVTKHEAELRRLLENREVSCRTACRWLDTRLMRLADESFRRTPAVEKAFYDRMIKIRAVLLRRLADAHAGRTYLAKLLKKHPGEPNRDDHLVTTYVLPEGPTTADQFGVARKQVMAIMSLWEVLASLSEAILKTATVSVAVTPSWERLNNVFGQAIYFAKNSRATLAFHVKKTSLKRPVNYTTVHVHPNAAKFATTVAVPLDVFGKSIEVYNSYLAIDGALTAYASADTDFRKGVFTTANLIGSVADFAGAWKTQLTEAFPKLGTKALARVALVGAVMDFACAADQAVAAYQTGDYNQSFGQFVVATGAVITAVGCIIILAGAASAPAPPVAVFLGIVGAVVAAVGWVVTILGKDSDLETFVAHTVFGDRFRTGTASPKWQQVNGAGTLADWANPTDGLDRQLNAFYNLLAGFSVEPFTSGEGVVVVLNMSSATSKVAVQFVNEYLPDTQESVYIADLSTQTIKHSGSGKVHPRFGHFVTDSQGRQVVGFKHPSAMAPDDAAGTDVNDFDWKKGKRPDKAALTPQAPTMDPIRKKTAFVLLELDVESKTIIPRSKTRVKKEFYLGKDLPSGGVQNGLVLSKDT